MLTSSSSLCLRTLIVLESMHGGGGVAALSLLYRELGRTAFRIENGTTGDHIGDIGGWMALVQVWALERFPSIARRVHPKRKQTLEGRTVPRMPE
ncbi:hypothetical protein LINPERPRIM_LOCUS38028 [Linum perenne]